MEVHVIMAVRLFYSVCVLLFITEASNTSRSTDIDTKPLIICFLQ